MAERLRALQAWDDVPFVGMDNEWLLIARINGEEELRRLAGKRDEALMTFLDRHNGLASHIGRVDLFVLRP